MKVVVIGGTGLIGSNVVKRLAGLGHQAIAASPNTGVNTITGEGLAESLTGADVVIDVTNSPSFEPSAVLEFFRTSTANQLAAEKNAGVRHHIVLSIVGADRLADSAYLRAKVAQEELVKNGGVPYTIVRATQFFEFAKAIAGAAATGESIPLTPAKLQPVAADDVADAVTSVAVGEPVGGTVEVAGPEQIRLSDFARRVLQVDGDARTVVDDPQTRYFGAVLDDHALVPQGAARIGTTTFSQWLAARAG